MVLDSNELNGALTQELRTARAFVPGHITGLFRIYDAHPDPLHRGSRGAGFSTTVGTLTTVTIRDSEKTETSTIYNGKRIDALVTETVVAKMSEAHDMTLSVEITHESNLPIGVGFGASGAGALGTALALSSLIDRNIGYIKAAQFAHQAEVINHAGLGDVIAQTVGGLEIRTKPGAPGLGEVVNIPHPTDLVVVLAGATGLETKAVLTNPQKREKINIEGERLLDDLVDHQSLNAICEKSRSFAASVGLETPRIEAALSDLHKEKFAHSSQVMLGDSAFCICKQDDVKFVKSIFMEYWDEQEVIETTIYQKGGEVIQ